MAGRRAPRNEYIYDAIEAAQMSLVLALKGLSNPGLVAARQTIELVLKHVFFASHPIEYSWARTRLDYRELTFSALLEFIKRTDEWHACDFSGNLVEAVNHWYAICSRHVHVHNRRFSNYGGVSHRAVQPSDLDEFNSISAQLWPALGAMLVIFSSGRFARASVIEQRLIRKGLTQRYDKPIRQHLRSLSV